MPPGDESGGRSLQLSRSGETHELDAEARPGELGPALERAHTSVRVAVVLKTGDLEMTVHTGAVLWVLSYPEHEAWTLTVTDGPIIVSGPVGS